MTDRNWPPVEYRPSDRASQPANDACSPSSSFLLPAPGPRAASRLNTRPRPNGGPGKRKNAGRARYGCAIWNAEKVHSGALRRISNLTCKPGLGTHPASNSRHINGNFPALERSRPAPEISFFTSLPTLVTRTQTGPHVMAPTGRAHRLVQAHWHW